MHSFARVGALLWLICALTPLAAFAEDQPPTPEVRVIKCTTGNGGGAPTSVTLNSIRTPGYRPPRITDEVDLEVLYNTYPWMGFIYRSTQGHKYLSCSAVFISDEWALTAAHCQTSCRDQIFHFMNGVGKTSTVSSTGLASVWTHPSYDPQYYGYDIALIHAAQEIDTERRLLGEVKYPIVDGRPGGSRLMLSNGSVVFGFGINSFKEESDDYDQDRKKSSTKGTVIENFKRMKLRTVSRSTCSWNYGGRKWKWVLPETALCAKPERRLRSPCYGHSGGPLLLQTRRRFVQKTNHLVGIISHGASCEGQQEFPVFTKVRSVADWIQCITRQELSAGGGLGDDLTIDACKMVCEPYFNPCEAFAHCSG